MGFKGKNGLVLSSLCASMCCSAFPLFAETNANSNSSSSSKSQAYDADLFNKDKSVYFATAEFLYWLVNESALDYAVKMTGPAWSSTHSTFATGGVKNATFDWTPGFRIGAGHFNAPHTWDVFAQYTYVPAFGLNKSHAPDDEDHDKFLVGTFAHPSADFGLGSIPLQEAESRIRLDYHVVDLLFSRRFQPNDHLRLNVFGGPTGAFLYQNWKIFYTDLADQKSKIQNRWQFQGAGLRLGVKLDWYFDFYDFYMTGWASNGLVSGWYKNSAYQKTDAFIPDADSARPFHNTHYHDIRLLYTANFMVGPSWQKRFDCCRVEAMAGYELTVWTNLHEIWRSSFDAASAPKLTFINDSQISLQGLTVRVNVDF